MKELYARGALIGFLVLALSGCLLRLMFVAAPEGLNYQFLLHSHSHFAFSGWIFQALTLLLVQSFLPDPAAKKFRWVWIANLCASFGMLISFLLWGYNAVSISFSTLFIIAGWWFSIVMYKAGRRLPGGMASKPAGDLLNAALVYLSISAIGPFAIGPIAAAGLKSSPLYMDAIYFFLHFQMNGWMLLASLALVLKMNGVEEYTEKFRRVYVRIFIWSTAPLFLLFTLWAGNTAVSGLLAVIAAMLNLIGWFGMLCGLRRLINTSSMLTRMSLLALTLKVLFQPLICFPDLGNWVFANRNVIIGYIHLLMLGAISPIIIGNFIKLGYMKHSKIHILAGAFALNTVVYVAALFLQPLLATLGICIPFFQPLLLIISLGFLLLAIMFIRTAFAKHENKEDEQIDSEKIRYNN